MSLKEKFKKWAYHKINELNNRFFYTPSITNNQVIENEDDCVIQDDPYKLPELKYEDAKYNVVNVANYIVNNSFNIIYYDKLQGILYFIQTLSLIEKERPFFKEKIYAREDLIDEIKYFGEKYYSFRIPKQKENENNIEKEDRDLIHRVLNKFGEYSGKSLKELMESQFPFKNAYISKSKEISLLSLYEYFTEDERPIIIPIVNPYAVKPKEPKVYDVLDVAYYIIHYLQNEKGRYLGSNELQLLLYLCQAKFLAETGSPCFREDILAKDYCPIVKVVAHKYGRYNLTIYDNYKNNIYVGVPDSKDSPLSRVGKDPIKGVYVGEIIDSDKHKIEVIAESFSKFFYVDVLKKIYRGTRPFEAYKGGIIPKEEIGLWFKHNPNLIIERKQKEHNKDFKYVFNDDINDQEKEFVFEKEQL